MAINSIYLDNGKVQFGLTGKITAKGLTYGTNKSTGKENARFSVSCPMSDYDLKTIESLLKIEDGGISKPEKKDGYKDSMMFVTCWLDFMLKYTKENLHAGDTVILAGILSVNDYQGKRNLSLNVKSLRKDFRAKNNDNPNSKETYSPEAAQEDYPVDDMVGEDVSW